MAALCGGSLAIGAAPAAAENDGLALTPPMGWNDWAEYGCNVSAGLVEQTASAMVSDGMKAAGYDYVNIDDCWMAPSRDAAGDLVADPTKFPDGISAVASYVHSLGLKLGIYEDAGTETCAGYPGSYGHEAQDAATFASWGVDYVKYDLCNVPFGDFPGESHQQVYETLYTRMSNALKATGRPIVFSMSDGADPASKPWLWGGPVANLWRTGNDLLDNFGSLLANFTQNVGLYPYAGPGGFNDPDLLDIGDGGETTGQYEAEFSLWAEMAAPLIASTNIVTLPRADLAIYENPNVIAVDQDPLGKQGVPISSAGGHWVLSKPLQNGDRSVVLFNATNFAARIATTAAAVGLPRSRLYRLEDLWTNQQTESGGTIAAFVPADSVVMYRVSPIPDSPPGSLAAGMVLSLSATRTTIAGGQSATVSESFTNEDVTAVKHLRLSLAVPRGWRSTLLARTPRPKGKRPLPPGFQVRQLSGGQTVTARFRVTAPAGIEPLTTELVTGAASLTADGLAVTRTATLGEQLIGPVHSPFATADTTGRAAVFGESDSGFAIEASGTGIAPAVAGVDPLAAADSYAAIYAPRAAGSSSIAQVTITLNECAGEDGGSGLIERNTMSGAGGSPASVALYVDLYGELEMAWSASGGPAEDSGFQLPRVVVGIPVTLRLVRDGDSYSGYYSTDGGATWDLVDTVTAAGAATNQDVGVFHASGFEGWSSQADFSDFSFS